VEPAGAAGIAAVVVKPLTAAALDALPALGLRPVARDPDGGGATIAGPPWAFVKAAEREGPARGAAAAAAEALERHGRLDFRLGGKRRLDLSRPVVMAVVNVTPDSFSDGGELATPEAAAERAVAQAARGAALVDVGGESTRPGASPVAAAEEIARVVPAIERIVKAAPGAVISIDTVKAEVADAALRAGAAIVNDVSGLRREPALGEVAARHGAAILLGHMRGTPATMASLAVYGDVVAEVLDELAASVKSARAAGIPDDRIVLDPGFGFSKTAAHNWELLRRLAELRSLGYPLAVGASRKSFLGEALGGRPPAEREDATAAVSVLSALAGARILRVHESGPTLDALAVVNALTARDDPADLAAPPEGAPRARS
jgi:dihydropteroate synthase